MAIWIEDVVRMGLLAFILVLGLYLAGFMIAGLYLHFFKKGKGDKEI